jgi:hypothetical protein
MVPLGNRGAQHLLVIEYRNRADFPLLPMRTTHKAQQNPSKPLIYQVVTELTPQSAAHNLDSRHI